MHLNTIDSLILILLLSSCHSKPLSQKIVNRQLLDEVEPRDYLSTYNLKGKVKSITVREYSARLDSITLVKRREKSRMLLTPRNCNYVEFNEYQLPVKGFNFKADGSLEKKFEYTWDEYRNPIRKIDYEKGDTSTIKSYYYNLDEKECLVICDKRSRGVKDETEIKFNEDWQIKSMATQYISKGKKMSDNKYSKYTRSGDTLWITTNGYSSATDKHFSRVAIFDSKGNQVRRTSFDKTGKAELESFKTNTEDNKILEKKSFNYGNTENLPKESTETYYYSKDSLGNKIMRRENYSSANENLKTLITFYNKYDDRIEVQRPVDLKKNRQEIVYLLYSEYDSNGNWTYREKIGKRRDAEGNEEFRSGRIHERSFEYYE